MNALGSTVVPVLVLAVAPIVGWGCGAPDPCASSTSCPSGLVCNADGECGALDPAAARFTRGAFVPAVDWAVTTIGDAGPRADDVLAVGGHDRARTHLAFGPLPRGRAIAEAVLRITPHETWAAPDQLSILSVRRTRPFEGAGLDRAEAPAARGAPLARAAIAPHATRAIRLDVTDAVRAAEAEGARRISFAIDLDEGRTETALRFASPRAYEVRDRPRLELQVR